MVDSWWLFRQTLHHHQLSSFQLMKVVAGSRTISQQNPYNLQVFLSSQAIEPWLLQSGAILINVFGTHMSSTSLHSLTRNVNLFEFYVLLLHYKVILYFVKLNSVIIINIHWLSPGMMPRRKYFIKEFQFFNVETNNVGRHRSEVNRARIRG